MEWEYYILEYVYRSQMSKFISKMGTLPLVYCVVSCLSSATHVARVLRVFYGQILFVRNNKMPKLKVKPQMM